jgi:hypothetical protein
MINYFLFSVIVITTGCTLSLAKVGNKQNERKIDSLVVEAPDSLPAKEIFKNYINAIGGRQNLNRIEDRTTLMESEINKHKIKITIYQKAPDEMRQIITTGPIEQNIYFDGEYGLMEAAGKKINITGSELEKLKYESMINFITNLDSLGVKLKYAGFEEVTGKHTYKIEMLLPSGSIWIQNFDTKTFLKVKETVDVPAVNRIFKQETFYGDYREVDGIKYPFSIIEILGSQNMYLKVIAVKINTGIGESLFKIN